MSEREEEAWGEVYNDLNDGADAQAEIERVCNSFMEPIAWRVLLKTPDVQHPPVMMRFEVCGSENGEWVLLREKISNLGIRGPRARLEVLPK